MVGVLKNSAVKHNYKQHISKMEPLLVFSPSPLFEHTISNMTIILIMIYYEHNS